MKKSRIKRKQNEKRNHRILKFFLILVLTCIVIVGYAYFIEPNLLTTKDYLVKNSKITDNFKGFKIIQISDIHYGRQYNKNDLKKLVKRINEYKPDIIVLTGDLIDRDTIISKNMIDEIANELKKLEATVGKFAITGNHDYKFDEWESIIKSSNFTNLNNTYETIYNGGYDHMVIAGVSSMQYDDESINERTKSATDYINSFEKNGPIYNILLLHEPDYIDGLENNKFDLILAGHSHAGLVRIPFYGAMVLPPDGEKYNYGHYKLENSDLYVSNGLGVSNINFRFFNIPSFNVYRLINK